MKKKIFFSAIVLVTAVVGALNLNIVQSKAGDIHLQNIEVLSYGESGINVNCNGIGTLDCPANSTKVYFIW